MDPGQLTLDLWIANEQECLKTLSEPESWEKVPLLSDNETAFGTLVRFKAMIQDMRNPEYFAKNITIFNSVTNETRHCQGKYHNTVINEAEETVEIGEEMLERQINVCIPIPGLNEWAKDMAYSSDEIEDMPNGNVNKRIRLDPTCQKYTKEVFVFVYPDLESRELKVNSVIEVVGFLDKRSINDVDEDQEEQTKEVRCIHTVLLKVCPDLFPNREAKYDFIEGEATNLYSELKLILTQALLGDALAADYLLFYLISSVYNRQNNQVLGKFSLNIRGVPSTDTGKNYAKQLYSLISHLVVKSEYLPLTIDNMNKMDMIPRKCYTTNRLLNGFLQLSNRTHLVLDETNLQPGRLDSKGLTNFQGLSDIISNQHLNYDFTYYKIDYETEIPVLTLSVGKSILPCDIAIVLNPDRSCLELDNIEDNVASALSYLNAQSSLSDKLRMYIAMVSTVPFNFKEDVLKVIEDDYVKMRRIDSNVSADDLHHLLMISKLIALCNGRNELNQEVWEKCKTLENERKLRIK